MIVKSIPPKKRHGNVVSRICTYHSMQGEHGKFAPKHLFRKFSSWSYGCMEYLQKKSRSSNWWIPILVFLTWFQEKHVQEANVESTSGEPEVKVSVVINIKKMGVDVYYSSTWSTIRTLLHGKIGTLKIDRYWMSLGDGFGFLLFFRVVSGDYGEPWSITVCDLLLDSSNLSWVCGVLISKTWGWWNPSPMMLENSHTTEKKLQHILWQFGAATISSCLCIRKNPRETDFLMGFWGSFLCNDLLGQRGMWGKRSSHSTRQKP